LRLAGAIAIAQAANGLVCEVRPGVIHVAGFEGNGNPELGIEVGEVGLGRGNADDLAADAVEKDGVADDVGIGAKLLMPESVA